MRVRPLVVACALAAAACATGGQRPRFGAAPEAVVWWLKVPADTAIVQLDARARALGLPVTRSAPREGYIELGWYDVARRSASPAPYDRLDSIVKVRIFADPTQGRTRVLAEAMQRVLWDPSMPQRELERMVPAGHPARMLLDSVLVALQADSVVRDTTKT
jgi:hypothetical protein